MAPERQDQSKWNREAGEGFTKVTGTNHFKSCRTL